MLFEWSILGGKEEEEDSDEQLHFPGVYIRQFMPHSADRDYNIVVSAFTLMDKKNQLERVSTVMELWRRTKNYLVI